MHGGGCALAGSNAHHSRVALNLSSLCNLNAANGCQTFMSDMKLRLEFGQTFYCPDVMLVCDPQDREAYVKTSPCRVAEVLSCSTELADRREKWPAYQKLASLREYLLLAQHRPYIEVHQRLDQRHWGVTVLSAGDTLELSCGKLSIAVNDLYRGVDFLPPA